MPATTSRTRNTDVYEEIAKLTGLSEPEINAVFLALRKEIRRHFSHADATHFVIPPNLCRIAVSRSSGRARVIVSPIGGVKAKSYIGRVTWTTQDRVAVLRVYTRIARVTGFSKVTVTRVFEALGRVIQQTTKQGGTGSIDIPNICRIKYELRRTIDRPNLRHRSHNFRSSIRSVITIRLTVSLVRFLKSESKIPDTTPKKPLPKKPPGTRISVEFDEEVPTDVAEKFMSELNRRIIEAGGKIYRPKEEEQ